VLTAVGRVSRDYGHADPRDAQVAKALTLDEARRIAANIANLRHLLGKGDWRASGSVGALFAACIEMTPGNPNAGSVNRALAHTKHSRKLVKSES